jgi:hypothetical protein
LNACQDHARVVSATDQPVSAVKAIRHAVAIRMG